MGWLTWRNSGEEKSARHSRLGLLAACRRDADDEVDRPVSQWIVPLPTYKLQEPVEEDGEVQRLVRILQLLPQRPKQQTVAERCLLRHGVSHAGHCVHDS